MLRLAEAGQRQQQKHYDRQKIPILQLIVEALMEAEDSMLTGAEICSFICQKYPSYKMEDHTWQHTLRSHLSRHEAFEKIPNTRDDRPGCFWKLQDGFDTQSVCVYGAEKTGKVVRGPNKGPRKRKVGAYEAPDLEGLEDLFKREKTEEIEPECVLKEEDHA